jgi:uncharacterized membrane protein YeaQ/YmgE (transglycosylase-associated protein family)
MLLQILVFLLIGALAGYLASSIMKTKGYGLFGNMAIGVLGALIGGLIFSFFGVSAGGLIGSFIVALLGSILVLFVASLFKK